MNKMSLRHQARESTVQFLFQMDFNRSEELPVELAAFWKHQGINNNRVISFAEQLIYGVEKNRDELDALISTCADNWRVDRMGAVDRNVLRMAAFEMVHCLDTPPVVIINEAVDVAKALSNVESGRFVNGILDQMLRKVNRPARTGMSPAGKADEKGE
jgi:N utilization substance protein B